MEIRIEKEKAYARLKVDGHDVYKEATIYDGGDTYTFDNTVVVLGGKRYSRKNWTQKWFVCDMVKYVLDCSRETHILEPTRKTVEVYAILEDIDDKASKAFCSGLDRKLKVTA